MQKNKISKAIENTIELQNKVQTFNDFKESVELFGKDKFFKQIVEQSGFLMDFVIPLGVNEDGDKVYKSIKTKFWEKEKNKEVLLEALKQIEDYIIGTTGYGFEEEVDGEWHPLTHEEVLFRLGYIGDNLGCPKPSELVLEKLKDLEADYVITEEKED